MQKALEGRPDTTRILGWTDRTDVDLTVDKLIERHAGQRPRSSERKNGIILLTSGTTGTPNGASATPVAAIVTDSLEQLTAAITHGPAGDPDPARVTAEGVRRAVRLAFDEPQFAQLLVNLDRADEVFAAAMRPQARVVEERGVAEGRFDVPNVDASVNFIVSGALSLIRQILAGAHHDGIEHVQAELTLRLLGISASESRSIAGVTNVRASE